MTRLERGFPIISVCLLDLFDTLTPEDTAGSMTRTCALVERMAEAYTDTVFWIDLKVIAEGLLSGK